MKFCTRCKAVKPLAEFGRDRRNRDGLRSDCKACLAAYHAANSEKIAARKAKYYAAHKKRFLKECAEYRAKNKEKRAASNARYRASNKEKRSANLARWRTRNYEKYASKLAARCARRRARKLQASPAWADQNAIARMYSEAKRLGMHVDHEIPLQHDFVCGLHWEGNLRLLPPKDNFRKSNKFTPQTYSASRLVSR